jgi:hypothetical protein
VNVQLGQALDAGRAVLQDLASARACEAVRRPRPRPAQEELAAVFGRRVAASTDNVRAGMTGARAADGDDRRVPSGERDFTVSPVADPAQWA